MNREKILFLIVLAIAVLWGFLTLTSPYEPGPVPTPRFLSADVPEIPAASGLNDSAWLLTLVTGRPDLPPTHTKGGRTVFVPHTDLLPVEPAVLPLPRSLGTPWVLPPVSRFPGVPFYRWFRVDDVELVAGGGESELPEPGEEDVVEEEPEEGPSAEDVLGGHQREFVPSEWDRLTLTGGIQWYGTISLKDAEKKAGHTKYELLLPENAEMKFYWEQIDTKRLTVQTSAIMSIKGSRIESIEFSDTIENRYYSRRSVQRVATDDADALIGLGRYVMELAEEERYDRMKGLELAVKTFREALAAEPKSREAVLALGEALHRAFRFDEELTLYEEALAARPDAELHARKARIFRKLGLDVDAEEALTKALGIAGGDTATRLVRANVRFDLGRYDEAMADFEEVERLGSPEEKTAAREGRARSLLATGRPSQASRLLSGAEDAASLVTRGCALYAERKWADARSDFEKATNVDPESAAAFTNLGFAQAMTAKDAAGIEAAIATLEHARELDALNYYYPPLGRGFAEQRRDERVESVDRYKLAELALPGEPYVHYVLGRSYLRDGRYEDARREFLTALELDYRFADALYGAGTASLALSDWPAARAQLERVVTLERRAYDAAIGDSTKRRTVKEPLARARYRLGRAWLLSDDQPGPTRWKRAGEQFAAILALDDTWVPAHNMAGFLAYQEGDAERALTSFDKALTLVPRNEETPDGEYAKTAKGMILDSQSRRRWVESFDRPDTTDIGNGWAATDLGGTLKFRISDGRVKASGRAPKNGGMWLLHGDPKPRGRNLNGKFIRVHATVNIPESDRISFRFVLMTRDRNQAVTSMIGLGRNALGQVVSIAQKSSDRDQTETVLEGEDGQQLRWPTDDVTIGIDRVDPDKGVFALFLGGERVATLDFGLRRRTSSDLNVGFYIGATNGEAFDVGIDEVEMEIYDE